MFVYCLRRLLGAVPTLLILAALTFFLIRLTPGGPFDADHVFPPEIQENINHVYGLDKPVPIQFAHWLKDAICGDLHDSFQYMGKPVREIIFESLPASLEIGFLTLLFSVAVGIPLACLSVMKRGTFWDYSSTFLAVAAMSLPNFLVASFLILIFSIKLHWLPPALWEGPESLILPVLTLAARPLSIVARMTRASLIEALSEDYIRTAYGKGLSRYRVVFKHALKNSLIPVITSLGPITANLVTGSFAVEVIFQIPGVGRHFVQAVLNRDYPLVMGVTLVYGVILILCNLAVDLFYGWADPRIRLQ